MKNNEIYEQLERLASADNFVGELYKLTDAWSAAEVGEECIETILMFMETHTDLDYGTPGPLVHFLESFYDDYYEVKLIESISRKPTHMTVWMLNRVINVTAEPTKKALLISIMRLAESNPNTDQDTLKCINIYLDYQKGLE